MKKTLVFLGFCAWVLVLGSLSIVFFASAFFAGVKAFEVIAKIVSHQPFNFEYARMYSEDVILSSMLTMVSIMGGAFTSWLALGPVWDKLGNRKKKQLDKSSIEPLKPS